MTAVADERSRAQEIVRDHLDMVYASALRQVRDAHLAADVTQAVFLVLQRKIERLDRRTVIGVWLLRVTRYACLDAQKLARRRNYHEKRAAAMRTEVESARGDPELADEAIISGLIDEALDQLSQADRVAIVLAYIEGIPHEQIGRRLGIGAQAAHKRV